MEEKVALIKTFQWFLSTPATESQDHPTTAVHSSSCFIFSVEFIIIWHAIYFICLLVIKSIREKIFSSCSLMYSHLPPGKPGVSGMLTNRLPHGCHGETKRAELRHSQKRWDTGMGQRESHKMATEMPRHGELQLLLVWVSMW